MNELKEIVNQWDIEKSERDFRATGTERYYYKDILDNIRVLSEYKFHPYQRLVA